MKRLRRRFARHEVKTSNAFVINPGIIQDRFSKRSRRGAPLTSGILVTRA